MVERYPYLNAIRGKLEEMYPSTFKNPRLYAVLGREPRTRGNQNMKCILTHASFRKAAAECGVYGAVNDAKGALRFSELMVYVYLYYVYKFRFYRYDKDAGKETAISEDMHKEIISSTSYQKFCRELIAIYNDTISAEREELKSKNKSDKTIDENRTLE